VSGLQGGGVMWARRFATGLSSLWDRAAARLAALRFNPSRISVLDFGIFLYCALVIVSYGWLVFFSGVI
jgi:hypothetical protein